MAVSARTKMAIVAVGVGLFCAGCGIPKPYFVSTSTGDGSDQAEHARLVDYWSREDNPLGLHYDCFYPGYYPEDESTSPQFYANIKNRYGHRVYDIYASLITPLPPGFKFYKNGGSINADNTVAPGHYEIIVKVIVVGKTHGHKIFGPREPLILSFEIPSYPILRFGCLP